MVKLETYVNEICEPLLTICMLKLSKIKCEYHFLKATMNFNNAKSMLLRNAMEGYTINWVIVRMVAFISALYCVT